MSDFIEGLTRYGEVKAGKALENYLVAQDRCSKTLMPTVFNSKICDYPGSRDNGFVRNISVQGGCSGYTLTSTTPKQRQKHNGNTIPIYAQVIEDYINIDIVDSDATVRSKTNALLLSIHNKESKLLIDTADIITLDTQAVVRVQSITKNALVAGMQLLMSKDLPVASIAMTDYDYLGIVSDINSPLAKHLEATVTIVICNTEVLPIGNMYIFTMPEFLGVCDILKPITVSASRRDFTGAKVKAYKVIAGTIGNNNGIVKVTTNEYITEVKV